MTANYTRAKEEATKVLQENFITAPPIDVYEIAKNEGLSIETRDFGDKFNNISGYIKPEIKTIFVNSHDAENRRKFTIAHELGHWILHKDKLETEPEKYAILYRIPLGRSQDDPIEQEANCFAANLLVPDEMLKARRDDKEIEQLATEFDVSRDVIGYRIQDLTKHI